MSKETFETLRQALYEHFSDEGLVLTDWYLVAAGASMKENGMTAYQHFCSDSPFHSLLGMVNLAAKKLDHKYNRAIEF